MFPFGHIGFTILLLYIVLRLNGTGGPTGTRRLQTSKARATTEKKGHFIQISDIDHIDLRILILGVAMPDIIDKVVGHLFLADTIDNGRIMSHTLLVAIMILALSTWRFRERGFVFGLGWTAHLFEDMMWNTPETFAWPAFGLGFPEREFDVMNWIEALRSDTFVQATEAVGIAIIIILIVRYSLLNRKAISRLIRTGHLAE